MPVVLHQSDIAAFNRCPQELKLDREGIRSTQNSRAAFGSVMHHAISVLVRYGDLSKALATFEHYWHPFQIEALCDPVPHDGWIANDSYGGLRQRGLSELRVLAEELHGDDAQRIATEYNFVVPLTVVDGQRVYLSGTMDSLAVRFRRRLRELHVEDWKTGQNKYGLRWNMQGTAYVYATTREAFWVGQEPIELRRFGESETTTYEASGFPQGREVGESLDECPRRFVWIDVRNARPRDGGYRADQDFQRLKLAAEQLVRLERADVWPLRMDGETCRYCAFRKECGGVPVPDEDHGDPWATNDNGETAAW